MLDIFDDYNWEYVFAYADRPEWVMESEDARDGKPTSAPIKREDVVEVIAYADGMNDELDWLMLGKVSDGRYFYVTAGCDYTGWGCQEWGRSYASYDRARLEQFAVTFDERIRLKMS